MSKSIKIDDATYEAVAKFAQQEDRLLSNALARLVKLGLANASEEIPVKEQAAAPVENLTVPASALASINWQKAMEEVTSPEGRKRLEEQLRAAEEREVSRRQTVGDLTEEDLATAKVEFKERPGFTEPEEWDPHNFPSVEC